MTANSMNLILFFFVNRTIDPTKIIVTGKRIRFSFVGISDIIYFDPNQANPAVAIANYQQVRHITFRFETLCIEQPLMSVYFSR